MKQGLTKEVLVGIDTAVKPELKVGGRTCLCTACGIYFTGLQPFDRHFFRDDGDNAMKCRTPDEMGAIGMTSNRWGVWQYGLSAKELERLAKEGSA